MMMKSLVGGALLCAAAVGVACADTVVLGTDYYATQNGSSFFLGGNQVELKGNPIGPGVTDTIIQRLQDVALDGTSGLKVTALSLVSAVAVPLPGGGSGLIYLTLDPTHLADDTGTVTIRGSAAGGTFDSTLTIYYDICKSAGANGVGCGAADDFLLSDTVTLSATNTLWGPTPPPGTEIVEGNLGDQAANKHLNLGVGQTDFFARSTEIESAQNWQDALTAATPLPGALPMFVSAGGGLLLLLRRRRKRSAAA